MPAVRRQREDDTETPSFFSSASADTTHYKTVAEKLVRRILAVYDETMRFTNTEHFKQQVWSFMGDPYPDGEEEKRKDFLSVVADAKVDTMEDLLDKIIIRLQIQTVVNQEKIEQFKRSVVD